MRKVTDTPNICPVYLRKYETWDAIKNYKPVKYTAQVTAHHMEQEPPQDNALLYPVTWQRGNEILHEVQARYHQEREEPADGNTKGWGNAETFIFWNTATSKQTAETIANGTHPKTIGFRLVPII